MEDRFKFRAWDKNWKKMITESDMMDGDPEMLPCVNFEGVLHFFEIGGTMNSLDPEGEHFILMQCTGLKDKQGKLIFEGDLFRVCGHLVWVVFNQKELKFELKGKKCGAMLFLPTKENKVEDEIIGNIYENPELLEDK